MTTSDGARLFIGGQFRATEQTADVVEAATETALVEGVSATAADVDAAVGAARSALPGWCSTPAQERAVILGAFAGALSSRAPSASELISRETGRPISVCQITNGALPAVLLECYANMAAQTPAEDIRPAMLGHTIVRCEPTDVVAAIPPWNYPHELAAFKVAQALAAGCTVVLKAAPETALDAMISGRPRSRPVYRRVYSM